MWHKAIWKGHPMRLELTRVGLLVELANLYTTRGAFVQSEPMTSIVKQRSSLGLKPISPSFKTHSKPIFGSLTLCQILSCGRQWQIKQRRYLYLHLDFKDRFEAEWLLASVRPPCVKSCLLGDRDKYQIRVWAPARRRYQFLFCSSRSRTNSRLNVSRLRLGHLRVGDDVTDKHCIALDPVIQFKL